MRNWVMALGLVMIIVACSPISGGRSMAVTNMEELEQAIETAQPGDKIVMADGVWKDAQILFSANGVANQPITLRAQTPGKVTLEGQSNLRLSGEYLIVDGLHFKNGYTPSNSVIQFRENKENIANHCKVINCVIENYNQPNRYNPDHWVEFYGRHNELTRCYLAGKSNQGPTLRVYLSGNEHIRNYHQITNNHFGPRPRKGGPKAETMQIGDSYTSMTPSYVQVANNYFEKCDGEVEIISSKSNFNEFRNNVFYQCEGSLVMRHGNYCIVDGNIFIGNKDSQFNGGIRVINTGHWITNNYFYMLKGDEFRSALAIMNGIPKSPLNRYNQVTDAVVAYNTWVDCETPWQFSVGANIDKKEVLPASEIRSARPIRTVLANNIIYNSQADPSPFKAYDEVDGILFKNNLIDNQGELGMSFNGVEEKTLDMTTLTDWYSVPALSAYEIVQDVYPGYGFEEIKKDLFGNPRAGQNNVGASLAKGKTRKPLINEAAYGPAWYSPKSAAAQPTVLTVNAQASALKEQLLAAAPGDVLELSAGVYDLTESLLVDKPVTIRSLTPETPATLLFSGAAETPVFEMNPYGKLVLQDIVIEGKGKQYAFAPLSENMSAAYGLEVHNSTITGFDKILYAYRGSFADTISFINTEMSDCSSGIILAAETDDKGDYNAEHLNIVNCEFSNIKQDVLNFYRGGYDESTIGGNLLVSSSSFENCGKTESSKILLKTRGIINVNMVDNTFQNNPVQLVALLWGEKDNRHANNTIKRSGKIRVDQYLKQKLVY